MFSNIVLNNLILGPFLLILLPGLHEKLQPRFDLIRSLGLLLEIFNTFLDAVPFWDEHADLFRA